MPHKVLVYTTQSIGLYACQWYDIPKNFDPEDCDLEWFN
jgi:uncharacterized protein YodC (DUF2158 family)